MIRVLGGRGVCSFGRSQRKTVNQMKQEEARNAIISELDDRRLISLEGSDAKR